MANSCKYYKQKKQFSTNSGQTWQDVTPFEYRRGSFIEADSPDCREGTLISRWITVPDVFVCDGKNKYEKQVGQYSLDNGATWQYYYPSLYQSGNLIEANADICNNKWEGYYEFTGETPSNCPVGTYYAEGRGCVAIPSGQGGAKSDPVKYIRCSSNTSVVLTRGDVFYNDVYDVYSGKIGDCVTEIGNGAFNSFYSLTGLTIPDSVTSIGYDAFDNCVGLTSINIPDSVISIGRYAFQECTSLTSATIGSGLTSISEGLFYNCSGLTNVTIGNGVTIIQKYAFQNCRSLTSINIPDNVTSIGNWAFAECSSLTSVTIGSGITSITSATFADCSSLTSITIPSGVTRIGNGAFSGCTSLTSVTIEATTPPTLVNTSAFRNTNNCPIYVPCDVVNTYRSASGWRDYALRIVGIPPCGIGTTKYIATYVGGSISSGACDGSNTIIHNEIPRNGILSVEIIECVSTIDYYAFVGYTTLTSVTISNTVTSIEYGAFWRCTSLSSITIPDSVTSIGNDVFANCESLSSIIIPSGVTSIGDFTFSGCTSLTSVTIPNNVTSIGYYVFANCTSLPNITIPSGVTSIDYGAFAGCTSLTSVTIPNNVTSIGYYVFANCTSLPNITIPSGVTRIGDGAFSGCTSLPNITIPSGVTRIGDGAFSGCTSLTSVTINATTPPTLGSSAFTYTNNCPIYVPCESLDTYKSTSVWRLYASRIYGIPPCVQYRWVESGTTCIGYDKYQNNIKQVSTDGINWENVVPAEYSASTLIETHSEDCGYVPSPKWIATYTGGTTSSAECSSSNAITQNEIDLTDLTSVEIKDCVSTLGFRAFKQATSLTSVTMADAVTLISGETFAACTALTSVNLSTGLTTISGSSFQNCPSLTSVTIPASVQRIGSRVFERCSGLTRVTVLATTPPSLASYVFDNTNNCPIYVPCDSVNAYKSASGWSTYASRIYGTPPCAQYRWIESGTTCIGYDKYQNNIKQVSYDYENWENVIPEEYSASTLIEINSVDCGYIPIIPKWTATYSNSHIESATCDSSSAITQNEITLTNLVGVEIGNCVTSIGNDAFYWCSSLRNATIGSGVTSIDNLAFAYCSGLTSIEIPDSVASIGNNVFQQCYGLKSATIGSGITSIGDYAFRNCTGLTSITIEATTPPTLGTNAFAGSNCPIMVPCDSVSTYKSASGWSSYANRIGLDCPFNEGKWFAVYTGGTTSSAACDSTSAITSGEITKAKLGMVQIGDCVTSIGNGTFWYCSALTFVNISENVTSIGDNAFRECRKLQSITIPNSVTSIGDSAFYNCSGITSVVIPSGVTSIGMSAFNSCSSLSSVTVQATTPPTLGSYAFNGTSSSLVIYVPSQSLSTYQSSWSAYRSKIQPIT